MSDAISTTIWPKQRDGTDFPSKVGLPSYTPPKERPLNDRGEYVYSTSENFTKPDREKTILDLEDIDLALASKFLPLIKKHPKMVTVYNDDFLHDHDGSWANGIVDFLTYSTPTIENVGKAASCFPSEMRTRYLSGLDKIHVGLGHRLIGQGGDETSMPDGVTKAYCPDPKNLESECSFMDKKTPSFIKFDKMMNKLISESTEPIHVMVTCGNGTVANWIASSNPDPTKIAGISIQGAAKVVGNKLVPQSCSNGNFDEKSTQDLYDWAQDNDVPLTVVTKMQAQDMSGLTTKSTLDSIVSTGGASAEHLGHITLGVTKGFHNDIEDGKIVMGFTSERSLDLRSVLPDGSAYRKHITKNKTETPAWATVSPFSSFMLYDAIVPIVALSEDVWGEKGLALIDPSDVQSVPAGASGKFHRIIGSLDRKPQQTAYSRRLAAFIHQANGMKEELNNSYNSLESAGDTVGIQETITDGEVTGGSAIVTKQKVALERLADDRGSSRWTWKSTPSDGASALDWAAMVEARYGNKGSSYRKILAAEIDAGRISEDFAEDLTKIDYK